MGVEEASLIAPTRTSSLIGKLDRVPVHWRDHPHAIVHWRDRPHAIGKLDRVPVHWRDRPHAYQFIGVIAYQFIGVIAPTRT